MPIRRARFRNFTVFDHAEFDFSPGVNVLIGKNGTGKSHVLKALYGLTEGLYRTYMDSKTSYQQPKKKIYSQKVAAVGGEIYNNLTTAFSSQRSSDEDTLFALRRRQSQSFPQDNQLINIDFSIWLNKSKLTFSCLSDGSFGIDLPIKLNDIGSPLFIPPREVLSMYPGFVALYEKHRLSFDRTYFDLCQALSVPELREVPPLLAVLARPLEIALGGRVVLKGEHFVIERPDGELDINMEAEGLRKFAMLLRLIANGSLRSEGTLYWDEPEANMNPALVVTMKEFLIGLAQAGVQVFLATHDYLLCRELSLEAEYGKKQELIRFFCLNKNSHEASVTVEAGSVLADLKHNPIVAEFAAH